MKIDYDPQADAMTIKFQDGDYEISREVADGVIIDYTKAGKVISIEILDVSKRLPKESLKKLTANIPTKAV